MTEQTQRLYDCITEIGDSYLQEAEQFQPEKNNILAVRWRRFGTLAAAIVVAVGLGRLAVTSLPRMGANSAAPSSPSAAGTESSAPAACDVPEPAPAASKPAASAPTDVPEGTGIGGENDQVYSSYGAMARDADLIIEAEIISVTPDVALDTGETPGEQTFTVVELAVADVLKGDAEQGETILLNYPQNGQEYLGLPGERSIYFMRDRRGQQEDMPYSLMNLSQAAVAVDGDLVLADADMLNQGDGGGSMDKELFKDLIRQAMEE